jgi:GDP-L-fucose synthase
MKILILGGHGFVGKNVSKVLTQSQHDIRVLSRRDGLDLTDLNNTKRVFYEIKPDIIVNLSALVGSLNFVTQIAANIFDTNMRMLLNIYKAIQDQSPQTILINPIANCAYPGDIDIYSEDLFWAGKVHQSVLAYGNTRRMIEVLSECYNMQYGIKSVNYFVPNMYGPFDSTDPNKAHALNALISRIVKAQIEETHEIEVWGSGKAIREWLFAQDFARIVQHTIDNINDYIYKEPVNIAQNSGLSIKELLNLIIKESKYNGEIFWNKNMSDGAPKKVMDDSKFTKLFPDFKFTEISEGIKTTIEYYKSVLS